MGIAFVLFSVFFIVLFYTISKYSYKKTKNKIFPVLFIISVLFIFVGDYLLVDAYLKWACASEEAATYPETTGIAAYDLDATNLRGVNRVHGCGRQCAAALLDHGFDYAEATVSVGNQLFLTWAPGHYRFHLAGVGDPRCSVFERYYPEAPSEEQRDFHYVKIPEGRCIASEKMDVRSVRFMKDRGPSLRTVANNIFLDFPNYKTLVTRLIDEKTGAVVAADEIRHFYYGWYINMYLPMEPHTSSCTVRRYRRWPELMALREG